MRFLYRLHSAVAAALITAFFVGTTASAQQPAAPAQYLPEASAQQLLMDAQTVALVDMGEQPGWPQYRANAVPLLEASLKNWGRYRVVRDPAQADVILQLTETTQPFTIYGDDGSREYIGHHPYLKLTIVNPHSMEPLWTITVPALAGLDHKRDLFDMSVENVTSQLKLLNGMPLAKQQTADLNYLETKRKHAEHWLAVGGLLMVGAFATAVIVGKLAFDKSVEDGKEQQKEFCIQNHIPNCAV
ncbi:MAG: hypothetical protein PW792_03465 [Acidobacteriaceae bacterium]|nr:hypothetical protein [Acidobacteriaceae bacterium]